MNELMVIGGDVSMTSVDVAQLLNSRHADIKRSIQRLAASGVISTPPMAFTEEINNLGFIVKREHYVFSGTKGKRDSLILVAQNCPEFTAAIVDRWQELEGKMAAAKPVGSVSITDIAGFAEIAGRALNMSNSSRLGMFQKIQSDFGIPNILPAYAIDAPSDAVDGSSRPTKALTAILKGSGHAISAKFAYQALQQLGIVERMSRKSTKGEKEFWALTAKGLLYGKNITSPNNPREVQPHFYESRSADLVKMIFDQVIEANDNGGEA